MPEFEVTDDLKEAVYRYWFKTGEHDREIAEKFNLKTHQVSGIINRAVKKKHKVVAHGRSYAPSLV